MAVLMSRVARNCREVHAVLPAPSHVFMELDERTQPLVSSTVQVLAETVMWKSVWQKPGVASFQKPPQPELRTMLVGQSRATHSH